MKGFKSFNSKSAIKTGVSVLVAGAGSAVADWALEKYDVSATCTGYDDYEHPSQVTVSGDTTLAIAMDIVTETPTNP